MKTRNSEFGRIKAVLVKRPEDAFVNPDVVSDQWKDLNYLDKPDFNRATEEYNIFERYLTIHDAELFYLPKDESVTMDSIYCRDASISTDFGMIICNMGKPARMNEPAASHHTYEKLNIPVLGTIEPPGTVEGGDVAWLDQKTLAVGHTYRTNQEGIRQLSTLLEPYGVTLRVAEMPHYKGPSDVFHLMSVFSPVAKDLAVVYSTLMPISFRTLLLDRGYSLVEVPDSEWDSMACNVLAIAPRECIMVSGNPVTRQRLLEAGCTVHQYDGYEISVKGGGGPTCLTRPILREL